MVGNKNDATGNSTQSVDNGWGYRLVIKTTGDIIGQAYWLSAGVVTSGNEIAISTSGADRARYEVTMERVGNNLTASFHNTELNVAMGVSSISSAPSFTIANTSPFYTLVFDYNGAVSTLSFSAYVYEWIIDLE